MGYVSSLEGTSLLLYRYAHPEVTRLDFDGLHLPQGSWVQLRAGASHVVALAVTKKGGRGALGSGDFTCRVVGIQSNYVKVAQLSFY